MQVAAATSTGHSSSPSDALAPEVLRVMRDDGSIDEAHDPRVPDDELVGLYSAMVRARVLDERLVALQRQGRIGFHVGAVGEEAAILGATYGLRQNDWIFPCYREFASALWRGLPLQQYIDNMFGNANDVVRGRQMPDHCTYRKGRFVSVSSPVGTQITQAVGFAWAAKLRHDALATLVFFGDGATSSNDFHSGMNFAGVFKVPTIFLCRNNGWAISTPATRQTASATFGEKAAAYGVPYLRCDGNDVLAVIWATRAAVSRAARGEGATLIEAVTYRLSGHTTSDDPKTYRTEDEVAPWLERDPLPRLRRLLAVRELWTDARQAELEARVAEELRQCVAIAEKAPPPSVDTMFQDVYAELPWHLREQRDQVLRGPRPAARER